MGARSRALETPQSKTPWALENIPPFPAVALRLLQTLSEDEADLAEIARIIEVEPILTGRILKLANSPLYGSYQEISSIPNAICMLGLIHLKAITTTHALGQFVGPALNRQTLRACWENSLAGAVLSEKLAVCCSMDPDFCYLGGLMRDIGRLALLIKHPESYEKLLSHTRDRGLDLMAAERALFDIDHCSAGAWLVEKMPFPELREAVSWHHEPLNGGPFRFLQLVHVADAMSDALGFGVLPCAPAPDFETALNDLPEPARSRFSHDPRELQAEIRSRIQTWA